MLFSPLKYRHYAKFDGEQGRVRKICNFLLLAKIDNKLNFESYSSKGLLWIILELLMHM